MLILLESGNRILYEAVISTAKRYRFGDPGAEEKTAMVPIEVKFCDFDGTRYRVSVDPEDLNTFRVSMSCPSWGDLVALGVKERIAEVYKTYVSDPEADYDVTLALKLSALPEPFGDQYSFDDQKALREDGEKSVHQIASKLCNLKFVAFGAPFQKYFKSLQAGKALPPAKLVISDETTIYFTAKDDRVVVIYSIHVKEKFDEVVSRVFLNSLCDKARPVPTGPVCSFDYTPPNEMKSEFGITDPVGNVGFVSMAILPRHVTSQEKIDKAAGMLQNFRSYLNYHVKCSKTFFHSQMRARCNALLQVLNRAKSSEEEASKKKKTASGRTFERKDK